MHQSRLILNGASLAADLSGALWWEDRRAVVVADLHLEKGSAFAERGRMLPPYDTAATLRRLAEVLRRLSPRLVVCLGDSFHDRRAAGRLSAADREHLGQLMRGREWIWIAGNHDPQPPADWGGAVADSLTLGPLVFRHEGAPGQVAGEVSGHYHPKADISIRSRRISARCFVHDGRRLILPAFGAYAGGLGVLDPAIARLMDRRFHVTMIGDRKLYSFPSDRLAGRPETAPLPPRIFRRSA